ncbi:MAG: aminoglycoside phosphotransferase family protein [Chloroflexota bacterium]
MPLDFSLFDAKFTTAPSFLEDITYLRQEARSFIQAAADKLGIQEQQVVPLPLGTWNVVVALQPLQRVLKISPWASRHEADYLQLAFKKRLKAPTFFAYGDIPTSRLPNASYTLMKYIPNCANPGKLYEAGLLSPEKRLAIAHEVGEALAKLHQEHVGHIHGFGEVKPNWGAALNIWKLEETAVFDTELLGRFERILQQTTYREFQAGVRLHSDANLHNILVDAETHDFRALIDPGPVGVGMGMYDLAYAAAPWINGWDYLETAVSTYRNYSQSYNEQQFYVSLLYVAYQHTQYGLNNANTEKMLVERILPRLE